MVLPSSSLSLAMTNSVRLTVNAPMSFHLLDGAVGFGKLFLTRVPVVNWWIREGITCTCPGGIRSESNGTPKMHFIDNGWSWR